ncbi:hypothetical protein C8034_v000976 [Colletotrichum sidae]|uniref:DUF5672 domain-containing protein n=1 Tax=Colletotrichum sidae TaxID=1347389 RepID=A0A4R8T2Y5_9PEZI|nr:hypothetical protein C8034_v000976 [Colletotrichum sidae]
MAATTASPGVFAITKGRLLILASLAITWWFAHILPNYKPMIKAQLRSRLDEARLKIPKLKVDWNPSADPRAKYNASKLALIIEPRPLPHLVPQLLHMTSVVPPDWRFLFIGTNKSVVSVSRSFGIKHQQIIGKLDLMVLPEPWEIESKEHVYRMLTDLRFYDEFLPNVEWILKFESDSILCSNSPTSLNEWLGWSWAGAPKTPDDRFSGNGGLSLRRVSAIKRVLQFQERYNDTEAEDEWFGKRLWVMQGEKVAHGRKGVLAVEDVYLEKPMGYHVKNGGTELPDKVWKDPKQRKRIFDYCPELSLIMDMKLERERCDGDNHEGGIGPTDDEKEKAKIKAEAAAAKAEAEEEERKKKGEEEKQKQAEEERKKAEEQSKNPPISLDDLGDLDDLLKGDSAGLPTTGLDDDADAKAKAMAAEARTKAAAKEAAAKTATNPL